MDYNPYKFIYTFMPRHCNRSFSVLRTSLAIASCVAICSLSFLCYSYYAAIQDVAKGVPANLAKVLTAEYNVGITKYAYEALRQERRKALDVAIVTCEHMCDKLHYHKGILNILHRFLGMQDSVSRYVRLHKLRERLNVYGHTENMSYLEIFAVSETVLAEAILDDEYAIVRQQMFIPIKHIAGNFSMADAIICESYMYLVYSIARMSNISKQYKSVLLTNKSKLLLLCDSLKSLVATVFIPYCDILLSLDVHVYEQYGSVLRIPCAEVEQIISTKYATVPHSTAVDAERSCGGFFIVREVEWEQKLVFLHEHLQSEYGILDTSARGADTIFYMLKSRLQHVEK